MKNQQDKSAYTDTRSRRRLEQWKREVEERESFNRLVSRSLKARRPGKKTSN
jgi:hypothetical protein